MGIGIRFVWGAIFWIALPLPSRVIHPLPWETSRAAALAQELDTGAYYYPPEPASPPEGSREEGERQWEEFLEKHRQGPILLLQFQSEGREPMAPGTFLQGFLHFLLLAFLVAMLLAKGGAGAGVRGASPLRVPCRPAARLR